MTDKKSTRPMVQIPNVQLENLEKAVYSRDYEKGSNLLLENLRQLKTGAEFIGYAVDPATKKLLYTRFCAAMFTMLADPAYLLSQDGYNAIASEHAIIDLLFRASAFGTSDHMLPQMAADPTEKDSAKIKFKDSNGVAKYMITYSMRSGFAMNFEEAFSRNTQTMFSLYIGFLTMMVALSQSAQDRREQLLGMPELFKDIDLSEQMISSMSDAYMYCSYAYREDKHALKGIIHNLYAKMMVSKGFKEPKFMKNKKPKPTILVPVEWFTSLHAMYRCYAPVMRQLRTKFKLIGIGRPHAIDKAAEKEFDGWITIPEDGLVLTHIIDKMLMVKPDIIYYPSLGMDLIWVALASIRLAPIQMMTLGHPASSQSPAMDYVICEKGEVGKKSLFTEQIVELPENALFRFVMRLDAELPEPYVDENPDVIKIAIPAMVLKLNATFLATLKEIQVRSKRPIEFHLWPNMISTVLYQTALEIREWLPNALIYERNQYNNYIRQIQQCHIQLGTFPFGGTNSNLDCMLLGIPMVCMEGLEPHARVDAKMQRKAGMPEWLMTHDAEEYINAAVRLIENNDERVKLSRYLLEEANIENKFLGEAPKEFKSSFVDAVWDIYSNKY